MTIRIGLDLGGTKIEILALDDKGKELLRERQPTPANDYDQILQTLVHMVLDTEKTLHQTATVGVAIPGAVSLQTGRIKNANTTCLIGQSLQQDFSEILQREIRLANDANCFTLSEAIDGSGVNNDIVFGVILGTGVGGGISINRSIINGVNSISGEWGHNPLPWPESNEVPGPDCYCGLQGCIETFLSGPALSRDYQITSGNEKLMDAREIVRRYEQEEEAAVFTMNHYFDRLARSLATVINILDPDVIVLGGGLSNIMALYDNVPSLWQSYAFSDRVDTKLVKNTHGDSSGVRGAAWLWPA